MKLKELLKNDLTKEELEMVPSSFDTVGDILIFVSFPEEIKDKEKLIGETLISHHKNINVVLKKTEQYATKFRTPVLDYVAGEKRKETIHKENNVRLKLDVEKVYFSTRSSTERKRIMQQVKDGEEILVMFSGSAPYVCVIAKNTKAKKVVGVELNVVGHEYGLENLKLNKIDNAELINGDVREIVSSLNKKFDRILMPLPKSAEDFLDVSLTASKKGTIIHFYDFLHEKEFDLAHEKIDKACKKAKLKYKIVDTVKCGTYAPRTHRICVDFEIK